MLCCVYGPEPKFADQQRCWQGVTSACNPDAKPHFTLFCTPRWECCMRLQHNCQQLSRSCLHALAPAQRTSQAEEMRQGQVLTTYAAKGPPEACSLAHTGDCCQ